MLVAAKPDVHPRVVARAFGVHLRTVFRWVKSGHLVLVECRIRRQEVLDALPVWKTTISRPQAKNMLRVTAATITAWKERGVLTSVELFGSERIFKEGAERVLLTPSYRPGTKRPLFNSLRRRKEKTGLLTANEAAELLHLPVWKALPFLNRHAKKTTMPDGTVKFYKRTVLAAAEQYQAHLFRLRLGIS